MMKRLSVLTLLLILLFILFSCDNGSSPDSASGSDGLVKVSLALGGDSASIQKSVSVNGNTDWTSLTYHYNAVPQWSGDHIHGAADWTPVTYSEVMSLGYFSPGEWVFGVRVKNGANVVYEGFSDVTSITSNTTVDVLVKKLVTDAAAGSVRISVTAPSAQDDTLSISYTGDATGGPYTITAESASDKYPFEYTVTGLSAGTYNFTLTHSAGGEDDIEVVLPSGEMAVISGYLNNGAWHLDYNTVKVYSVGISWTGSGIVQANTTSAAVGDRVSFYVKPACSSSLESLSITCGGNSVSYTGNGSLYSFTMPDGNVSVAATFGAVDIAEIDIDHFKTIIENIYVDNDDVTAFGRSNSEPSGVDYLGIKGVLIWYDSNNNKICWYSENGNTFKFKAGSMAEFFKDHTKYTSISMEGIDTAAVTSMASMFDGCNALTSLTLTGLKTGNVTDMSKMFFGCCGLTSLVLDTEKVNGKFVNFDTSKVTDMSYMFSSAAIGKTDPSDDNIMNFTSLDVSGLDTSSVTNMSHMFYLCSNSNLTELNVSGFNTSNVTDMSYMFACWRGYPSFVTAVNMMGWDFSNVTTVNRMFDRCERAVITFPSHTMLSNIEDILYWFSHCFAMTPALLETVVNSWDFSGHVNTAALTALFAKADDANGEAVPNNRIMTNDMTNYKSTRQQFATHANNTVITTLYVGGNDLSKIRYQRLTTVANP